MARPKKKGLEYFPLDVDMLSDIKVRRLMKKDGAEAVAVYLQLLAEVYKQGYWLDTNEDTAFLVSEQVRMEEEDVTRIIRDCVKLRLFDAGLYERDGILTSHGIQERYLNICKLCGRSCNITDYCLITDDEQPDDDSFLRENPTEQDVSSEETPISSEETPVSSRKPPVSSPKSTQSKVKESKYNISTPPPPARACDEETDELRKDIAESLKPDSQWKETMWMRHKVADEAEWQALVAAFYDECVCNGKLRHESQSDLRSHMNNWLRKARAAPGGKPTGRKAQRQAVVIPTDEQLAEEERLKAEEERQRVMGIYEGARRGNRRFRAIVAEWQRNGTLDEYGLEPLAP